MFKKAIFFLTIFFLLAPSVALAGNDLIKFQDDFNLVEAVTGDAMLFGNMIDVQENVSGDLITVARDTVSVTAPIGQDFRAAAGNSITVNSFVDDNMTVVAPNITIGKLGQIHGNFYGLGSTLEIDGEIDGNLFYRGDSVSITGRVGGNVDLGRISQLTLASDALIEGDLKYSSDSELEIPNDTVSGEIIYEKSKNKRAFDIDWFWQLVWYFGAVAFGLILISFFDTRIKQVNMLMVQKPGKSILYGLLFVILLPIMGTLLLITLIGIPIGVTIFSAWILLMYLAPILAATVVGKLFVYGMSKSKADIKKMSMVWFLIIGLLLLKIVFILPVIGGAIKIMTIFWGLGGIILWARLRLLSSNKSVK